MSLSEVNLFFEDERRAVARAYRSYAEEVGAREWVSNRHGDTAQYVACFYPLIAALVRTCSQNHRQSKTLPRDYNSN